MKGIIIIPKFYKETWLRGDNNSSVWAPLFYGIEDYFNFKIVFADEVNISSDIDLVIMFGVPYHNRKELIPGILDIDKNIKLIMFTGDLQCYDDFLCLSNKIKVFDRCDLIISFSNEYFVEMYPQFLHKYVFMPHFFSTYERYSKFEFDNVRIMRCLFCGSINKDVYPLRHFVVTHKNENLDYHFPKYKGNDYPNLLNSYFCCLATSSIFNYVLAKYFEIMATGSLLLANETKDSKKVGLIPYKHYVPINKKNVFDKINMCLKEPEVYNKIRKTGMEFVRKNHSVLNRLTLFKKLINNL